MIAIIDYEVGNLRSVQKALEKSGAEVRITQDINDIHAADKLVLPGVGAMKPAMDKLDALNLTQPLKEFALSGKPFLGICVGFQLLFESSDEGGNVHGLGLLKGHVKRFEDLKVPQIGWNQIHIENKNCPLYKGIENGANVYFCHSYYTNVGEDNITATTTDYGVKYTSSVQKNNIYGVQFHPEKSQTIGLTILKNFIEAT